MDYVVGVGVDQSGSETECRPQTQQMSAIKGNRTCPFVKYISLKISL